MTLLIRECSTLSYPATMNKLRFLSFSGERARTFPFRPHSWPVCVGVPSSTQAGQQ